MSTTKTRLPTIQCPRCHQTLPGWADQCQFCGSSITRGFVRPVGADDNRIDDRPTWKEVSYIAVSALLVLRGVWMLLLGFNVIPNAAYAFGGGTFYGLIGSVMCALGLGMLFHQLWAQFVMKWLCILGLIVDGFGLLRALMFAADPRSGWLPVVEQALYLGLNGFTLFILYSEADV